MRSAAIMALSISVAVGGCSPQLPRRAPLDAGPEVGPATEPDAETVAPEDLFLPEDISDDATTDALDASRAPQDGGGEVAQNNRPTISSVIVLPQSPVTTEELVATAVYSDPNRSSTDLTATWEWTRDGQPTNAGGPAVAAMETLRGQTWVATVTVTDPAGAEHNLAAAPVIVGNSAPALESATLTPDVIEPGATVTCVWTGWTDADMDPESVVVEWLVDGQPVSGATDAEWMVTTPVGASVMCRVTPTDEWDAGEPVSSAEWVVSSAQPVLTVPVVKILAPSGAGGPLTCQLVVPAKGADNIVYAFYWTVGDGDEVLGPQTLPGQTAVGCVTVTCRLEASVDEMLISSEPASLELGCDGPDCPDGCEACLPTGECCPEDAFCPTSHTTISGSQTFSAVFIPAGVTVTCEGAAALELVVSGDVVIQGALRADAPTGSNYGDESMPVCGGFRGGDGDRLCTSGFTTFCQTDPGSEAACLAAISEDETVTEAACIHLAKAPGMSGFGPGGGGGGHRTRPANNASHTVGGGGGGGSHLVAGQYGLAGKSGVCGTPKGGKSGDMVAPSPNGVEGGSGGGGGGNARNSSDCAKCGGGCTASGGDGGPGGGVIRIQAGGTVTVSGKVSARGGDGGPGSSLGYGGGGGGGAGGGVRVIAPSIALVGPASEHFDVSGGVGGMCNEMATCGDAGRGGEGGNGQVILAAP